MSRVAERVAGAWWACWSTVVDVCHVKKSLLRGAAKVKCLEMDGRLHEKEGRALM